MNLQTRQPTGKAPWPLVLVAGAEKAGKSYACAQASASDLIGRTFWVGVGEDDPDEYGAIPGTRFEIVVHDGTYRGIGTAIAAAIQEPAVDGKPNLIVVDSATRLWELISDMAQAEANQRAADKARKYNRAAPSEEARIDMDLWNKATDRWHKVMDLLRSHEGPSLLTARLEIVTVMDDAGKPTKEKSTKIKAQKSLPYDVGIIVEMHARDKTFITGARSLKLDLPVGTLAPLPDFTVDGLWRNLGLEVEGATAPRQHSGANVTAPEPAQPDELRRATAVATQETPEAPAQQEEAKAQANPDDVVRQNLPALVENGDPVRLAAFGKWARGAGVTAPVMAEITAAYNNATAAQAA